MTLQLTLLLALGGAAGTLSRYFVGLWAAPISQMMPWGTVLINVAGSFVIGFFGTLTLSDGRFPVSENLRMLVMVGFCGGFTTFSSFSLQSFDLLRNGAVVRAAINIIASVLLCLCAVAVGHQIAARLNGGDQRVAQIPAEEEV
jgi:CrcB protein